MKKLTILTIMLSATIFGLFLLTAESKAQKDSQLTDKNSTNTSEGKGMTFAYFSCEKCFYEGDEIIGRDVKFKISGVSVCFRLIKLNQQTREFNTGSIKGKLSQNKIEISLSQDVINDGNIKYTADKVEKSNNLILLKGNAKLTSSQNESIETDEIIITTN